MACPRYQNTATVLADGRVLVAGGCMPIKGSQPPFGSAEVFDPATGLFSLTGTMAFARSYDTGVTLPDGRVLFYGGSGITNANNVRSAEIYDPAVGRFIPIGNGRSARYWAQPVVLQDGRVLLVGGDDWPGTAELFDPATDTFAAAGPVQGNVAGPAVLLSDGRVLSFGQVNLESDANRIAQIYDPATNTFTLTGRPPTAPDMLGCAEPLADGGAVLFPDDLHGTTAIYDAASGKFRSGKSSPKPMDLQGCVALADGRIFMIGTVKGEKQPQYGLAPGGMLMERRSAVGADWPHANMTGPFNLTGEIYDPVSNSWAVLGHLNVQRSYPAAVLLQDGRVMVVGGASDTAEFFDPTTNKFSLNK